MCDKEISLYSEIVKRCTHDMDEVVSAPKKKKEKTIEKYNILFTAMMRPRRLCNHGTFPIHPTAIASSSSSSPSPSTIERDAEFDCDFCREGDEDKMELVENEKLLPAMRYKSSFGDTTGQYCSHSRM